MKNRISSNCKERDRQREGSVYLQLYQIKLYIYIQVISFITLSKGQSTPNVIKSYFIMRKKREDEHNMMFSYMLNHSLGNE